MILITGNSTLAIALQNHLQDSVIAGRPTYDFKSKQDCKKLIKDFPSPQIVINTFADVELDPWDSLITNLVAPIYLTDQYYQQLRIGQIINISSTSAWWPSYPGIDDNRFFYNLSKFSLSEFGRQYNRKVVDESKNVVVTTIEIGKFQSPMSNFTGISIDKVVELVKTAIDQKCNWLSAIR